MQEKVYQGEILSVTSQEGILELAHDLVYLEVEAEGGKEIRNPEM